LLECLVIEFVVSNIIDIRSKNIY